VLQAGIKPIALSLASGFVLIFIKNYSLLLDFDPGWVWTIGGSRVKIYKAAPRPGTAHACIAASIPLSKTTFRLTPAPE
jgi:hypothetical protein